MKYKLVPIEVTDDMVQAALNAYDIYGSEYTRYAIEAAINTAPAVVVTDEMVERAIVAYFGDNKIGVNDRVYGAAMRAALEAALNGEQK